MSATVIDFHTRQPYAEMFTTDIDREMHEFAAQMVAKYGAAVAVIVAPPGKQATGYRVGCLARLLEEVPVFYNGLMDACADGA